MDTIVRKKRKPMSEINVVPYIDVMLVLLIIFMVTAPLLASGVPVDLPDSRANPIDQQPDQVTISIDPTGTIFIGNERVETGGLPDALAAIDRGQAGNEPVIVLRGDRTLQYARVMAVWGAMITLITTLNAAGVVNPNFITQPMDSL